MSEQEQLNHTRVMAKKMAMAYLTASVSNCYLQEGVDELEKLGMYRHEVKHRIGNAEGYYGNYNQSIKWIFEYCGADVKDLLCGDYDTLKADCDRFMNAEDSEINKMFDSDDLREEGNYLCEVSGANHVNHMVLHWERRQWSAYSLSTVSDGWVPLKAGVRVVKVLEHIYKIEKDEA